MFDPQYENQVRLLLRCLPEVARCQCFALKGGTAINLFLLPMPRISVDIDLAYLPLRPRDEALSEIEDSLVTIKGDIEHRVTGSHVQAQRIENYVAKLFVSTEGAKIKIEPNLIFRGAAYEPANCHLAEEAQVYFEAFVSVQVLSKPDLYGSKICAALDRQHPRDLFDMKLLLDGQGITDDIRRAFIIYLAGHARPINEMLSPSFKDFEAVYHDQFAGMVRMEVSLEELLQTRCDLVDSLVKSLDNDEKEFLVSMKKGEPEWNRLGIDHLAKLPALQWKLMNIRKMDSKKRNAALDRLVKVLTL